MALPTNTTGHNQSQSLREELTLLPWAAVVSLMGSGFVVGLTQTIAAASGSEYIGIGSGVAGAGILGAIGVQIMRTYGSSQKWKDSALDRQEKEIARLDAELGIIRVKLLQEQEKAGLLAVDNARLKGRLEAAGQ